MSWFYLCPDFEHIFYFCSFYLKCRFWQWKNYCCVIFQNLFLTVSFFICPFLAPMDSLSLFLWKSNWITVDKSKFSSPAHIFIFFSPRRNYFDLFKVLQIILKADDWIIRTRYASKRPTFAMIDPLSFFQDYVYFLFLTCDEFRCTTQPSSTRTSSTTTSPSLRR